MDDQIEQAPAVAPPWYLNQWITDLNRQNQTHVSVRFSRMNLIFSGRAIVLKNLSLPIILGMNFLKNNTLSPYLTPYEAKLVHIPSNQSQALIANIVEKNPEKFPPPLVQLRTPPNLGLEPKQNKAGLPIKKVHPPV